MRKEYDFDKMKGRRNSYAKNLKKQVTMRMGVDIIEYFKNLSSKTSGKSKNESVFYRPYYNYCSKS